MLMADWQERVLLERNQLQERYENLVAFLNTKMWEGLDDEDKRLLLDQRHAMISYLSVLNMRIARWE